MSPVHSLRVALIFGVVGIPLWGAGCSQELSKSDQETVAKQQEEDIKGSDAAYEALDARKNKR